MRTRYDAIVVGAGPAGAATAIALRRRGLDVVLLDRDRFPRDKFCGDAVARKSLACLDKLGLLGDVRLETHEAIDRAVLVSPGGHRITVDLNPGGDPEAKPHLVCRRQIFDDVLVRAARRELDVLEGSPVTDLVRDGNAVRGAHCRVAGRPIQLHARVVIGADGYNSIVARKLGIYRHDGDRWFVATRAYYRGLDTEPGTVEVHYLDDTLPGFLWIFPTGDGIANVGLGLIHRDLGRRGLQLRAVHESAVRSRFLGERFATAERIGGIHGWHLPTPDFSRTLCGDGFLLVGDAAGLVDPFSGEGIGNAMVSADVAADLIAAACEERPHGALDLSEYPRRLRAAIDEGEITLHYRLRALARRRRMVDFIVGRAAAHPDVLRWITAMTAEDGAVARKRALMSPPTYLGLLFRSRNVVR